MIQLNLKLHVRAWENYKCYISLAPRHIRRILITRAQIDTGNRNAPVFPGNDSDILSFPSLSLRFVSRFRFQTPTFSLSLSLYVKRNSYGSSTMEKNANGRLFLLRSDKPCSICQRMAVVPDVNKSAHTFYAFTILSCSRNSLRGRFKRAGYSRWLQPRRISRSHLQLVSFYLYSREITVESWKKASCC